MDDVPAVSPSVTVSPARNTRAAAWRYVFVDQGLVAIFVNFAINWGIAWAVFQKLPLVPFEGELSITGDTIATCWMFPLISCLIVTSLTRQEVRKGRIPTFAAATRSSNWPTWMLHRVFIRAALFAIVGRAVIGPLAVHAIAATGIESLSLTHFLWFKSLFAVALGLFYCPFFAWRALYDPVQHRSQSDTP